MRQPTKNLTTIIKPTMDCNASCAYCAPGCGTFIPHHDMMSIDTLRAFTESLKDYCLLKGINTVTFIWHGGEPTLVPVSFYEEAKIIEESVLEKEAIDVKNSIQTNLTHDEDKIRKILKVLNIPNIGTSYDPDGLRALRSGDYNKKWLLNYMRLKRNYSIGVIYVINSLSLGRERDILAHFVNIGVNNLKLNWMYKSLINSYADEYVPSPEDWGNSISSFFRHNKRFPIFISEAREFRRGNNLSCSFEGSASCTQKFIGVSPEGDIYNCGRMMEAGLPFGNIYKTSIADMIDGSQTKKSMLKRDEYLQTSDCKECRYWKWCHGGCACDAFLTYKTLDKKTNMCEGYKIMFKELNNVFQPS